MVGSVSSNLRLGNTKMKRTQSYPNVGFARDEVVKLLPQWKKIRDCIAGETAVKAAAVAYLPKPTSDNSQAAKLRYKEYLERAVFYNVTRPTLTGLVGQVFAKDPVVKLPKALEGMLNDVSGTGLTLRQQSKKALQMTLAFSRCGLFTDYPEVDGEMTRKEIEDLGVKPSITVYAPDEIVNWRLINDGYSEKLALVVLHESYQTSDDGFEVGYGNQFRVLRLDESGEFVQEIWRERSNPTKYMQYTLPKKKEFITHSTTKPTDRNGKPLLEIPFTFVGSENNDAAPDQPNMIDIASLNLAHYRNSADYEEAAFTLGQAMLVITGASEEWQKDFGSKIAVGSRAILTLGPKSDAKIIQPKETNVHKDAMDNKERQMVALGARLIEQKTVQRTAYEASNEEASKTSILSATTKNVSDAYVKALTWALNYSVIGAEGEIEFELNTDFAISRMTAEQQAQVVELWIKGALTFSEMRDVLVRTGTATIQEPEKAAKEIAEEQKAAQDAAALSVGAFNMDEVDDDADDKS
jgi:hypothetical protein